MCVLWQTASADTLTYTSRLDLHHPTSLAPPRMRRKQQPSEAFAELGARSLCYLLNVDTSDRLPTDPQFMMQVFRGIYIPDLYDIAHVAG